MKKLLSLILAVLMLLAVAVPALAAITSPDSDINAVCYHSSMTCVDTRIRYTSISAYEHKMEQVKTYICNNTACGISKQDVTYLGVDEHNMHYTTASCNGTLQTRNKKCTQCGFKSTETVRCPGATHTPGKCAYLPI